MEDSTWQMDKSRSTLMISLRHISETAEDGNLGGRAGEEHSGMSDDGKITSEDVRLG